MSVVFPRNSLRNRQKKFGNIRLKFNVKKCINIWILIIRYYLIYLENEFHVIGNYCTNEYLIILYIYTRHIRIVRKIILNIQNSGYK